jgi:hypothetical protein
MWKRYFWVLVVGLGFCVCVSGQTKDVEVGFASDVFYASELNEAVDIELVYSVPTRGPRDDRGPNELVHVKVVGGSATVTNDYILPQYDVVFFDGGSGTQVKRFRIGIVKDLMAEGVETVELRIEPGYDTTILTQTNATLKIYDPNAGKVRFAATEIVASEAAGEAVAELVRDGGTSGDMELVVYPAFGFGPGLATYYDSARGPFMAKFADGQERTTIRVGLVQDSEVEGPERLGLTLYDPVQGAWSGADTSMWVTIQDDSINVSQTADGVSISWAAPCEGCELQRAEEAGAGASGWQKVEGVVTEVDGRFSVKETVGVGTRFYRLKK